MPEGRNFDHKSLLPVAALSLLAAPLAPALAQDKTFELKISHWLPPAHPLQKSFEEWGASVENGAAEEGH